MATGEEEATAKLTWHKSGPLVKLKLRKTENVPPDLNTEYNIGADAMLPGHLTLFDEDGDEIENASFFGIEQNYSIQYKGTKYYFREDAPAPQQNKNGPLDNKRESEDKSTVGVGVGVGVGEEPSRKRLKLIGDAFLEKSAEESGPSRMRMRMLPAWNRELQESKCGTSLSDVLLPIFVRSTYNGLAEKLHLKKYKRQVVTGMPGIGKSWFVDYFAQFCLKKGHAVILETDRENASSAVENIRRLELIVPTEDGKGTEYVKSVEFSDLKEVSEFVREIKSKVGSRQCWNLIDYQDEKLQNVLRSGALENLWQVLFASPARQRWKNFFKTDKEKGQEPILIMPVWTGMELGTLWEKTKQSVVLSLDELEVLVTLFGPSPRYCFSQFCLEKFGKDASELADEQAALNIAAVEDAKQKTLAVQNSGKLSAMDIRSSSALLEEALAKLNEPLREQARQAAQITRGRIMTAGVVEELENIHDSPTGSTCKSNVSSRLLIWGVQGDSFAMDAVDHKPYVTYASPYIAALVLEHNSKQALRSMARFFESGDRNVGAGSGWMYENFLLKYHFPSLKAGHEIVLHIIGTSQPDTKKLTLPPSYECCVFGELRHVSFQEGAMCIPTYRNLGAVDCFMILGETLYLFQVTIAASHSIVKSKLEELIELAKRHRNIDSVKLVFVIPSWRKTDYMKKAQGLKEGGKLVRVTGDIQKDTKDTLKQASEALTDLDKVKKEELLALLSQKKQFSTHRLRQKLKGLFAGKLRETGYQDSSLETWSVPRLLATYTSRDTLPSALVSEQSVMVVDKGDMLGDVNG